MNKRIIKITKDGSPTVVLQDREISYHSLYGAITESLHVFIQAGLNFILQNFHHQQLQILEMGFGTGLNCALTLKHLPKQVQVYYAAIEKYPLEQNIYHQLDYSIDLLQTIHKAAWNKSIAITQNFTLHKHLADLKDFTTNQKFHLIYYDAFAPSAQAELWTKDIFSKLYSLLENNGILVTYCSKGEVRRNLLAVGFIIEKLQGPPGKREMLRATKIEKP